jgi:hypothetical protein
MRFLQGCLFATLCSVGTAVVLAEPIPAEQVATVAKAEAMGLALYEAAKADSPSNDTLVSDARAMIADWCRLSYKPVVVGSGQDANVYFIAQPDRQGDVVFGRHYRVGRDGVTPSTKTCFVQPSPPASAVAVFITNVLSDTPTEFHVYLSLLKSLPIVVGTRVGDWSVENGKIKFLKARHGT